ncbi:MAG: hypothetical protein SGJ02_02770 [bacterium]|nr:hypothetical protein [bacterium]
MPGPENSDRSKNDSPNNASSDTGSFQDFEISRSLYDRLLGSPTTQGPFARMCLDQGYHLLSEAPSQYQKKAYLRRSEFQYAVNDGLSEIMQEARSPLVVSHPDTFNRDSYFGSRSLVFLEDFRSRFIENPRLLDAPVAFSSDGKSYYITPYEMASLVMIDVPFSSNGILIRPIYSDQRFKEPEALGWLKRELTENKNLKTALGLLYNEALAMSFSQLSISTSRLINTRIEATIVNDSSLAVVINNKVYDVQFGNFDGTPVGKIGPLECRIFRKDGSVIGRSQTPFAYFLK